MRKIFAVLLGLIFLALAAAPARAETDSVYQRVLKTQTINCGYAEWPPFFSVDPNTKKLSGLMYDVWEQIGKQLGLKIDWHASIGWGEVSEAVKANKIDAFCVGVWPDAGRMKNMLLSRPVFYNLVYLFARADDTRFDNNYEAINSPSVTTSGQEGDFTESQFIMKFPNAKHNNISPLAQQDGLISNVTTKKADVTLLDVPYAEQYMASNPGKLKQVKGPPMVIFPIELPLAPGEYQLKNMIDGALQFMINDGSIDKLIRKYKAKATYAPEPDVKAPGVGK